MNLKDGTWGNNAGMYDHLVTEVGKMAYCVDCDSYVGKTADLIAIEGN
ncbi:hypothetical protein ACR60W_001050 [Listeria monocytogenes]|nr:hypothetical protein [Listeria monocytogenes]